MRLVGDTRGQTLQDFAVGVGIFLVAFMFVLSLFPGLLSPFQSSASGAERAQAEQVTTQILDNLSEGSQPNHLDAAELATLGGDSEADLLDRFGLPTTANINLTVETLDGTRNIYASTNTVGDREVATAARIVTMDDARCEPACRLVVRVW
jgi:AraC-like DNA-binding protein